MSGEKGPLSRVLLHSIVFLPDGASTAYIMADLAVDLQRFGHRVTVLSTTPHYNIEPNALKRQPMEKRWGGLLYYSEYEGIPVWHVKLPHKGERVWARVIDFLRFHFLSLLACLRTIGHQDIVIATSPPLTMGVMSWLLAARWGASSVYKVAEMYPDLAIRQGVIRGRRMIALLHWLERLVYSRNTIIVAIAEQFCQIIKERGVPDQKLWMIPDFVDTDFYRPLPRLNQFAEKNNLLEDFVVLYGGNVGLVQDWESVLFAAEKLSHLPIQFIIVGDGARRAWLAGEVKKRRLRNFKMLGYQPKELMPEINACCDIGIIPLTQTGARDGFPSKIYSNLACGKPVLVSADVDSEMAALIRKAGCGRIVPPEDPTAFANAVQEAFQNRHLLVEEGRRGREFVETYYSRRAIASLYDALIRNLTIP